MQTYVSSYRDSCSNLIQGYWPNSLYNSSLSVIVGVIEGQVPEDGVLQNLESESVSEDVLASVYSGMYTLLMSALRLPQVSLKPEQFKADLSELR